jgi:hypothetical protein
MNRQHKQGEKDDHNRVRRQLRSLRKVKAPWYFESDLRRRLSGTREARRAPAGLPVPAYAMTFLIIIGVGVLAYYLVLQVQEDILVAPPHGDTTRVETKVPVAPAQQENPPPPPTEQRSERTVARQPAATSQPERSGPSQPGDVHIEAGITDTPGVESESQLHEQEILQVIPPVPDTISPAIDDTVEAVQDTTPPRRGDLPPDE